MDGVVANRVFPAAGADNWRRQWVAAQRGILEDVADSFRPLPIWESPYRAFEPVGVEELAAFAVEMYGKDDPFVRATDETSLWVDRHIDTDGRTYTLTMPLPLASASDLELARHGDELIITVGSYRRVLPLPAALARGVVAGARLEDGRLQVRFAPREPLPKPSELPIGTGPLESAQGLAQHAQEIREQLSQQLEPGPAAITEGTR